MALDKAVALLKADLQPGQFLGKGVWLCYDEESKTVYLADDASNIAQREFSRMATVQFH